MAGKKAALHHAARERKPFPRLDGIAARLSRSGISAEGPRRLKHDPGRSSGGRRPRPRARRDRRPASGAEEGAPAPPRWRRTRAREAGRRRRRRASALGSVRPAPASQRRAAACGGTGTARATQRLRMVGRSCAGRCDTRRNTAPGGRFLEPLKQRVGGVRIHVLGRMHQRDAQAPAVRAEVEEAGELRAPARS